MYVVQIMDDRVDNAELHAETPWQIGDLIVTLMAGLERDSIDVIVANEKKATLEHDEDKLCCK